MSGVQWDDMVINSDRKRLTVAFQGEQPSLPAGIRAISVGSFLSGTAIRILLEMWKTDYLLVFLPGAQLKLGDRTPERLIRIADDRLYACKRSQRRERIAAE